MNLLQAVKSVVESDPAFIRERNIAVIWPFSGPDQKIVIPYAAMISEDWAVQSSLHDPELAQGIKELAAHLSHGKPTRLCTEEDCTGMQTLTPMADRSGKPTGKWWRCDSCEVEKKESEQ